MLQLIYYYVDMWFVCNYEATTIPFYNLVYSE